MIISRFITIFLLTLVNSEGRSKNLNCSELEESVTSAQAANTVSTTPTYLCMEDWPKTCTMDSECCSGECLKPFCKILGIEEKEEKSRKKERRRKLEICKETQTPNTL